MIRGLRDGIDKAPQVLNLSLGNSHERERGIFNKKKCYLKGASSFIDPLLSIVASTFLYSNLKGQAKPEGCYPNRPAGATRRGSGYHRGRKSPSDNTHRKPSSVFFVFDEKQMKSRSPQVFSFPRLPSFVEPVL